MTTLELVPGLQLDDVLFGTAAAGVADLTDLPPLTWDRFTAPLSWWLIPESDGTLSKAEFVLARTQDFTAKLNLWYAADLRGMPHNHPWETFTGHLLAGGYDENRWHLDQEYGRVVDELGVRHTAGTGNRVDQHVFHEVAAVHEPGRTLSLMVCGRGRRGDWGYLDESGRYLHHSAQPVDGFDAMLAALNPQHRR